MQRSNLISEQADLQNNGYMKGGGVCLHMQIYRRAMRIYVHMLSLWMRPMYTQNPTCSLEATEIRVYVLCEGLHTSWLYNINNTLYWEGAISFHCTLQSEEAANVRKCHIVKTIDRYGHSNAPWDQCCNAHSTRHNWGFYTVYIER